MENTTASITNNSDEIDLIELLLNIWQKKWWVILFTVIFAGAGVLYALYTKEQWTSKAEIIAPRDYEIANVLQAHLAYARITDSKPDDLNTRLYNSLMTELRSVNSRVDFFKQSALYQRLTADIQTEAGKQGILRNLVNEQTTITWPDKKKEIDYPTIAFSAERPEEAKSTLEAYMRYLNNSVFELERDGFLLEVNNDISGLEFSLARMEERLPLSREIRLETQQKNLERALSTAKAAGIKEFAKTQISEGIIVPELSLGEADIQLADNQLSDNNFLFLMGEKYLQAQIDNVDKIPLIFPADYHFKKTQLTQLKSLLSEQTAEIQDQSFHYQSAPYLPLKRDKPKRALIVLIATLLGGMIGVIMALLMSALELRKKRTKP
ncbi:MAG: hypothetical protein CR975_04905 [Gammaproteobacteria bacterium]|nr:MAG: hypothetical protein CR975_04905 [Gammaproteobacteria bacterium]